MTARACGARPRPMARLAVAASVALAAPIAVRADPASPGPPPPPPPIQGWQYEVTPYLWLPALTGDLGVVPAI
ncbi:MAG TPA: hypothetical protein VHS81_13435, partial [Caulobacteraceae bacterium]|nr:hypothetical protein [Caulobacteraceae bacterium]